MANFIKLDLIDFIYKILMISYLCLCCSLASVVAELLAILSFLTKSGFKNYLGPKLPPGPNVIKLFCP